IRDFHVTGVQTCALPISSTPSFGDGGAGHGGWGSSYQQPAPRNGGGGRGRMIAAVLVAALVAGGAGGGLGYTLAKENDSSDSTRSEERRAGNEGRTRWMT